jgi:hypothetical protein
MVFTLTLFRRAGDEWYGRSGAAQAANHQVCNGIKATRLRLRLRLRLTTKQYHSEMPFAPDMALEENKTDASLSKKGLCK